ncbi:MAG: nucleotidyl transferase AbiEii/AbiGii toxin family protein [Clostridiales Family XIII bacterium]|jgi:predicted nucleotidyltransferase component of viral defense system|nr:nucleotidyl transferase AbiEii/AbiGii toxin family protein [Clostridiales Family XIII bacterium]
MFKDTYQLKAWIGNYSRQSGVVANTILQNYMMERLLERISDSPYRNNFILKGGMLIASMVGIDNRSTMDLDATIKGIPITEEKLKKIVDEIIAIDINDAVTFEFLGISNIHDAGEYDDFRISLKARFHNINVNLKIDITTGDLIIPREIEYSYNLLFEDRQISLMAYNINTILAEKIESILARNVANTRARDYYDVYILLLLNEESICNQNLLIAVKEKAHERGTDAFIYNYKKYLTDILDSVDVAKIWDAYVDRFSYAKGIELADIVGLIDEVMSTDLD